MFPDFSENRLLFRIEQTYGALDFISIADKSLKNPFR